jgi:steroid delta-isomerase-like uncharacterized protein
MHKQILKDYTENFWNLRHLEEADKLFHPEAVVHTTFGKYVGPNFMKATAQNWFKVFPDLKMAINEIIEESSTVALVWTASGTHKETFRGLPATNKSVKSKGVTIFRFEGTKVQEYWIFTDIYEVIKQIS